MKKITFILFALIAGTTFAQNSATASAVPAAARIVSPLTLTSSSTTLNFGQIATDAAGGTVILGSDGVIDPTSTAEYITETTTTVAVPTFSVTGQAESSYAITVPDNNTVTLTDGGSNSMTVTDFTTSKADNKSSLTTDGDDSFTVGATLNVGTNQTAASYTGSFNVTVTYN